MRHSVRRQFLPLVLVAAVWTASGCNNTTATTPDTTTTTTTPAITAATVTETFSGTLSVNGAASYPFSTVAGGSVTATLVSLGPDTTVTIGLSLGTWNGTACAVQTGIFNDSAAQSAVVTGAVSGAGTLCVRLYDTGKLKAPEDFSVNVTHP